MPNLRKVKFSHDPHSNSFLLFRDSIIVCFIAREDLRELSKDFDKSEDDLKSLQSGVGQIVGEVLRQLTEDKCKYQLIVSELSLDTHCSYCEGVQWATLCGRLQKNGE